MTKVEKALFLHESGFNCCQSVLGVFGYVLDMSDDVLLKLGSGFGGGMKRGEMCGAVTGALMVIGLKRGFSSMDDPSVKEEAALWTEAFLSAFEETCGALRCKDLLGYDFSVIGQRELAKESKVMENTCPNLMRQAVLITEKMINSGT